MRSALRLATRSATDLYRIRMVRHPLLVFERAGAFQIIGDAGGAELMAWQPSLSRGRRRFATDGWQAK